jgi:hypothetical protein
MNAPRAERVSHIAAIVSIWLAFLLGWGFRTGVERAWSERRGDLPDLTLLYLGWANSWIALVFPAVCTGVIVWLIRLRSAHLNWVACSVLTSGLLYALLAQVAFVLPAFKLCGSVAGCQP